MKHFKNLTVLLSFVSLSISACATSSTQESNPTGTIIEYKSGPEGFDTRTFFYVGKNEVVAIDSQFTPELAKKSIAHLRQFTDKPIKALIITHPNPDKFNGASVFKKEGAQIIGSKATADAMAGVNAYKKYYFVHMAKMFSEESYPSLTPIDETFEDSLTLNLKGDQVIRLVETNQPAISSNQTVVYIEGAGALFVGDMIHHKAHAWLEGGIVNGQPQPTVSKWVESLKFLKSEFPTTTVVYGGRGLTANLKEAAEAQIEYLQQSEEIIRDYIKELGSRKSELLGKDSSEHYKVLGQRFSRTFPEYSLSYMIEYGAYGLVNYELSQLRE